jgi:hypothetical protein
LALKIQLKEQNRSLVHRVVQAVEFFTVLDGVVES